MKTLKKLLHDRSSQDAYLKLHQLGLQQSNPLRRILDYDFPTPGHETMRDRANLFRWVLEPKSRWLKVLDLRGTPATAYARKGAIAVAAQSEEYLRRNYENLYQLLMPNGVLVNTQAGEPPADYERDAARTLPAPGQEKQEEQIMLGEAVLSGALENYHTVPDDDGVAAHEYARNLVAVIDLLELHA